MKSLFINPQKSQLIATPDGLYVKTTLKELLPVMGIKYPEHLPDKHTEERMMYLTPNFTKTEL